MRSAYTIIPYVYVLGHIRTLLPEDVRGHEQDNKQFSSRRITALRSEHVKTTAGMNEMCRNK